MKKLTLLALSALIFTACANIGIEEEVLPPESGDTDAQLEEQEDETPATPEELMAAPFTEIENDFAGTLTITGYLDVIYRECAPDSLCSESVNYAMFRIIESDRQVELADFIVAIQGNAFMDADAVGLGCLEEAPARIYSENFSEVGSIMNEIAGADLEKLQASSEENPVQIKISRAPLLEGSGAPDCYSHFRDFEVL